MKRAVSSFLVLVGVVVVLEACAFVTSQAKTSVSASCQQSSCKNVSPDAYGDCIARCQQ